MLFRKSLLAMLLASSFSLSAAPLYDPQLTYSAGSIVEVDGQLYEAKWWANVGQSPVADYANEWDSPWRKVSNEGGDKPTHIDGAPYQEGFTYQGGDIVANAGNFYRCLEGATVPWCAGPAWAYAPGVGSAWAAAWEEVDFTPEVEVVNITTRVTGDGAVFPSSLQVKPGEEAEFTYRVTSASRLAAVEGCDARINGNRISISDVQRDCQVTLTFEAVATLPDRAFNQNQWPSDLEGELEGTVLFAQSNTISSKYMLEGDIQPHLTAQRDALVLFKPALELDETELVSVVAKDKAGNLLGNISLDRPYQLPKIADQNPDLVIDGVPSVEADKTLETADVANFEGDLSGDSFANLLKGYDRINLQVDGLWGSRKFYLPEPKAGEDFEGKQIHFDSTAIYYGYIYYSGKNIDLLTNHSLTLLYTQGQWVSVNEKDELSINRYVFGHGFWNGRLPAEWIEPGVELEFTHQGHKGRLNGVKVGALTELQINTIDLGLLTEPRGQFHFADNEQYQRDYFETVPFSRMVVNRYHPLHLEEVMLANGDLLVGFDRSEGGVYSGNMRQQIAKVLISNGISNANYGLNSSHGTSEGGHPYLTNQISVHNAVGMYANGKQQHGSSGGGGIGTLNATTGNEWSHELGHNYSLGHFPGGELRYFHQPADQVNSSWGWHSGKNVFIPNIDRFGSLDPACQGEANCLPVHAKMKDAMGGGYPGYEAQPYTLHTPYSLSLIQNYVESKAMFSNESPSGYWKWNEQSQQMEPFYHKVATQRYPAADLNLVGNSDHITTLLNEYGRAEVNTADGSWTKFVHVPSASEQNQGNVLKFNIYSGYHVYAVIDGVEIQLPGNSGRHVFVSNGNEWVKSQDFNDNQDRVPEVMGVPVVTLLGYYDPKGENRSYVYPALEGAYGHIYADDAEQILAADCSLNVETESGETLIYKLDNIRHDTTVMNKFHVNVERSKQPTVATLMCQGKTLHSRSLSLTEQAPEVTFVDSSFIPEEKK